MISDAQREILVVTAFVVGLVAFMAWLMWPPVLSKLDAIRTLNTQSDLCNDNSCCNAFGCHPPAP